MYRIEIRPAAQRELASLPKKIRQQIFDRIELLAAEPRPAGVVYLKGAWAGYCRIRSGDYRIIYSVRDDVLVVAVARVGNRSNVYE